MQDNTMNNNPKIQIFVYSLITISFLLIIGFTVIIIDPFFHYHAPLTDQFYYSLNNERNQDDGIVKHFEYNAIVTGTSMTENFKVSEVNEIFGVNAVKVPVAGATYNEVNSIIKTALQYNQQIKMVIRCLDIAPFYFYTESSRDDLGEYPYYLYDNNILNDVKYIYNRDVIFRRIYPMFAAKSKENNIYGITSFDSFGRWHDQYSYGRASVIPDGVTWKDLPINTQKHFEEDTLIAIKNNIEKNIVLTAKENPDVVFYYFFTPYSALFWGEQWHNGNLDEQIEFERLVIEQTLPIENIYLFSFNTFSDITANLNYYKDPAHYGEWVNSMILNWIRNKTGLLTDRNYEDYLKTLRMLYTNLNYSDLENQEDYDCDDYLKIIIYEKLNGEQLKEEELLTRENLRYGILHSAELISHQHNGTDGIICYGTLKREEASDISLGEHLFQNAYNGLMLKSGILAEGKYLVFWGKRVRENGQPSVFIYDDSGNILKYLTDDYHNLDYDWHQYVIDISDISKDAVIIFHGGYTDDTGHMDSVYKFSDIKIMKNY